MNGLTCPWLVPDLSLTSQSDRPIPTLTPWLRMWLASWFPGPETQHFCNCTSRRCLGQSDRCQLTSSSQSPRTFRNHGVSHCNFLELLLLLLLETEWTLLNKHEQTLLDLTLSWLVLSNMRWPLCSTGLPIIYFLGIRMVPTTRCSIRNGCSRD